MASGFQPFTAEVKKRRVTPTPLLEAGGNVGGGSMTFYGGGARPNMIRTAGSVCWDRERGWWSLLAEYDRSDDWSKVRAYVGDQILHLAYWLHRRRLGAESRGYKRARTQKGPEQWSVDEVGLLRRVRASRKRQEPTDLLCRGATVQINQRR